MLSVRRSRGRMSLEDRRERKRIRRLNEDPEVTAKRNASIAWHQKRMLDAIARQPSKAPKTITRKANNEEKEGL